MTPTALAPVADPVLAAAAARIGTTLCGKWKIERLLGVGGMASVFAATHRNGKAVAIKVLHRELSIDPSIRARFLQEGYAANKAAHPGALSVLDDNVADDGSVFLVMDLLSGETIESRRVRKGGRLTDVDVLSIVDQLLDVLVAVHSHGIVHRDIKPDNVFLCRDGVIKVLDFGIARVPDTPDREGAPLVTERGTTMGTPAFMAPEQARGRWPEVDGRTDLWAVGATMFHLLSGRVVHEASTINEQLLAAMTNRAPPLSSFLPQIHPAIAAVVDRAMEYATQDRYSDAAEMQQAIRTAYSEMQGASIATAPKLIVPQDVAYTPTLLSADAQVAAIASAPTAPAMSSKATAQRPMGKLAVGLVVVVASLALVAVVASVVRLSSGGRTEGPSQATAFAPPPVVSTDVSPLPATSTAASAPPPSVASSAPPETKPAKRPIAPPDGLPKAIPPPRRPSPGPMERTL